MRRPHTLGVDDGPFDKFRSREVTLVAVMMEGPDLVEAVATTRFGVDGDDATGFLADWIDGLRSREALHGVFLGGITIAGLGVVDLRALADRLGLPVMAVNRRDPSDHRLADSLRAAGLEDRMALVERCPRPRRVDEHCFVSAAGIDDDAAVQLVRDARRKSGLPEPLRVAHLIARAVADGESRGRP